MSNHEYYFISFYGDNIGEQGMPEPFNNYIFFLSPDNGGNFTNVEIYAGSLNTIIPNRLKTYRSNYSKTEDVCDDVFEKLKNLPENAKLRIQKNF